MLNHLNENNDPTMVDVSEKNHSVRSATAQTVVELPEELLPYFSGKELILKNFRKLILIFLMLNI